MSLYYKPVAKARYFERLRMLGLAEDNDPYANKACFVDDLSEWYISEWHISEWHHHHHITSVHISVSITDADSTGSVADDSIADSVLVTNGDRSMGVSM